MTGIIGVFFILGIYVLMAMYANALMESRTVSHLLVNIKLSSLSESEKQKIWEDVAAARARTRYGSNLDFTRSNAQLKRQGLSSAQCTAKLVDFERESGVCLESTSVSPFETLFSSCPPADVLAEEIKVSCGLDLHWR